MTIRRHIKGSMIALTVLFATASTVSAENLSASQNPGQIGTETVGVTVDGTVAPQDTTFRPTRVAGISPLRTVAVNDLHADPRWPLMANCVNNTATPAAFQSCLQSAFLSDATGQTSALLGH